MKLLEIKDKKGSFFNGKEHVDIKELTGDALLFLVDQIHKLDDILLDPVTEENLPDNVAREIYSHVYQKLDELIMEMIILSWA